MEAADPPMKFARIVFVIAGIWGIIVVTPLYFLHDVTGQPYAAPTLYPHFFYGFLSVTMAWQISRRTGKVFIDHNMNRSGANISAAYSLRPEAMATVSTPLAWDEIDAGITPQDFRIENVWERFDKLGDLFEGVRTQPQDLAPAL